MTGKSFIFHALSLSLILQLAALDSAKAEKPNEFTIGLMAALSGDHSTLGNECRRGYELAQKALAPQNKVGEQPLRIVYADSQGVGAPSLLEFQRLVNIEHVGAVINHRSQAVMPLNPISARMKIPLLGILGHSSFLTENPFAFRFWPSTNTEAASLVQAAAKLNLKKVAVVSLEDEYTLSLKEQFTQQFEAIGGQIVFTQELKPSEQEFSSLIANLKRSSPDLIFVNLSVSQLGTFVRQCRSLGLKQQFIGNFWVVSKEFLENAGAEAAEGLIFAQINTNQPKFRQLIGDNDANTQVSPAIYTCFSAMAALLQALKSCTPHCDTQSAYTALTQLTALVMPDEVLPIKKRDVIFDMTLKSYHQGKIVNDSDSELKGSASKTL